MKRGQDIAVRFPGLYLVHHNLPGNKVAFHSHPEHLLFIPLQGEIEVVFEDCRMRCGPGRMIYLPPKKVHSFDSSSQQGERLIAMLDRKAELPKHSVGALMPLSQLAKEILFYLLLHPKTKHAPAFVKALASTLADQMEAGMAADASLSLDHLEAKAKDPRLKKAMAYLAENAAETLSMDKLAKESGLSLRTLNRLFTVELGLSPKQILTRHRISRARDLLLSGSSVTEAAYAVGYQSLTPFIRAFRDLTGQLPSELHRFGGK